MGFSREEHWSGFAISFSRGSSWPRDRTCLSFVSCIGRWIYHWATQETHCIEVRVLAAQSCPILCNPRAVPARLLFPWNSPGKNTGVGFHVFPSIGSLPVSQLFTSGGQRIGTSASASVLPTNIQGWFRLGLTNLISLQSKGLKSLLQHNSKASILRHSVFFMAQLSHPYMILEKPQLWLHRPLSAK